jgi:ATP-dependent phosphofructokinase / diphosphate-dependent phosphofructokinase
VNDKLAILVAGGPAPGINSVIGAATIRACLSGVEVLGIQEGFKWIMQGDTTHVTPLTISDTSRIHFRGGATLGVSRANPTKDPALLKRTLETLETLGVGKLITIGGDDTAFSAYSLARMSRITRNTASNDFLRVVHVPKTIDNDLDLPLETPTFGYITARSVGVGIVQNLMVDAKTTGRWYFVVAMGRKAGHLALGIGKAAGATITIVPEEFARNPSLSIVADTLAGSIIKRLAYGRNDGVAVMAEGIVEILPEADLAGLANVERDEHDHIRIAEVDFGDIVKNAVRKRLAQLGLKPTIVAKNIGYELRCADPVPSDMEYTRDLGYCAARYVIEGGTESLVAMVNGHFQPIPFDKIMDPATGRMRVRMVNLESDRYRIARSYMIRLRRADLDDTLEMQRLATVIKKTPDDFKREFGPVFESDLDPIRSMTDRPPPVG